MASFDTPTATEVDPLPLSAEWDSIVANAQNNGYKRFRIYGNDCGMYGVVFRLRVSINTFNVGTTFDLATAAAKAHGLPVLIGIYIGKVALPHCGISFTDGTMTAGTIASSASSVSPNPSRGILISEGRELKAFTVSHRSTKTLTRLSVP